jgi:oligosaccharide repeat unit polymerase
LHQLHFITAFGSNYIGLARSAGLGLLANLAFLLPTESKPWKKALLCMIALLQLWAFLASGSRGPVIAMFLAVFPIFFLSFRNGRYIERRFLLVMLFGVAMVFLISMAGQEFFHTLFSRLHLLFQSGGDSVTTRISMYNLAWVLWKSSPVFGVGPGGFGTAFSGEDVRSYPHNIFLELGTDTGLVGVALFTGIVFMVLGTGYYLYRQSRNNNVIRFLFLGFFFLLLNSLVSGDLNDNRFLFAFMPLLLLADQFKEYKILPRYN